MKELLKTNCFDTSETMIIMGSCLPAMQPKAYEQLKEISQNIYEICLEETHLNMAVTKMIGMIARGTVKKLVFATVDKSPHCIQLHYIVKELENMMNLEGIKIENYVAKDNQLVQIPIEVISLSKNLTQLKEIYQK